MEKILQLIDGGGTEFEVLNFIFQTPSSLIPMDSAGLNPLHFAIQDQRSYELIVVLSFFFSPFDRGSLLNESPCELAERVGREDLIEFFEEYSAPIFH